MYIDKKSPIPVYYQLKNLILENIGEGKYAADNLIPSEREFSELLGISRMTVRQALNQLVSEGVLYREKGKGTFVAKEKFEQKNIMSFSEIVKSKGLAPSTVVLSLSKEEAGEALRQTLDLKEGECVYHVKRLRLANNIPIGMEENHIPEKYCPGLEKRDLTLSLYKLIQEDYKHQISALDSVIEAAMPGKEEQKLLKIAPDIPVLRVSSTAHTESGFKLLYEKSVYRSDEYKYSVRVYGNEAAIYKTHVSSHST